VLILKGPPQLGKKTGQVKTRFMVCWLDVATAPALMLASFFCAKAQVQIAITRMAKTAPLATIEASPWL
jgi:hypothetical protein